MSPPRFQFTIRGLLVLTTVLGCFFAWLGVQVKWMGDRQAARRTYPEGPATEVEGPPKAPWSLRILGEKGSYPFVLPASATDLEQERIRDLFPEAYHHNPK